MPIAALAGMLIGYAFMYSGISQFATGGKGWGFMQSLIGTQGGSAATQSATTSSGASGITGGISALVSSIQLPNGGSTSNSSATATPGPATVPTSSSPVTGTVQA